MKNGYSFYDGMKNPKVIDAVILSSPVGCVVMEKGGTLTDANPAFLRFLGYTAAELKGLTFQQVTAQQDLLFDMEMYNDILKGDREYYEMVKRFVKKSGEIAWANLKVCAVRGSNGQVEFFIKHVVPILGHDDLLNMATKSKASGLMFAGWFVWFVFVTLSLSIVSCAALVLHFLGYV